MEYYDAEWGPEFVVIELHMAHRDLNFRLVSLPMSQVERPEILQLVSLNKGRVRKIRPQSNPFR